MRGQGGVRGKEGKRTGAQCRPSGPGAPRPCRPWSRCLRERVRPGVSRWGDTADEKESKGANERERWAWLNGFWGDFLKASYILSWYWLSRRPGCSFLRIGSCSSLYASNAALNLRSGCVSIFAAWAPTYALSVRDVASERASSASSMPEALKDEGPPSLASEVEKEGIEGALGGAAFLAPAFGGALTLAGWEASSSARRRSRSALRAGSGGSRRSEVSREQRGRCRARRRKRRGAPRAASAASALDSFAALPFAPWLHLSASSASFAWAAFAFLPDSCSSLRAWTRGCSRGGSVVVEGGGGE